MCGHGQRPKTHESQAQRWRVVVQRALVDSRLVHTVHNWWITPFTFWLPVGCLDFADVGLPLGDVGDFHECRTKALEVFIAKFFPVKCF